MTPTSGNAIYGFAGRAFGTAFAMVMAYVNWYIVDGKPAGVIVFFFISMMVYYHFLLRFPRFLVVFILAAVNHVLIIGKSFFTIVRHGNKYMLTYNYQDTSYKSVLMGLKRQQSQANDTFLSTNWHHIVCSALLQDFSSLFSGLYFQHKYLSTPSCGLKRVGRFRSLRGILDSFLQHWTTGSIAWKEI
jgi:hypothetical protein